MKTRVTCSPAYMLANNRTVSERGRPKWLTNSIGIMMGAIKGTGPAKCARYLPSPWARMPAQ
jgi:hypothetical protein